MRLHQTLEERGLAAVWWELAEASKTDLRLVLQAAARRVARKHQLADPPISHHVLLCITELDPARDTEETLTSGMSIFLLAIIALSEALSSRTATCVWDLLLDGGATPSMCKTTQLFRDQGVPPIEYWQSTKTTVERMVVLLPTLLFPKHPICGLLLGLIHFVMSRHLSLSHRARREPLLPSQFSERIHQDMDIYLQSVLALANKAFILPNIGDLQYALESPGPLITLAIAPTQPSTRALGSHRGGDGGAPSSGGGNGGSDRDGGSGSGSGGGSIRSGGGGGGPRVGVAHPEPSKTCTQIKLSYSCPTVSSGDAAPPVARPTAAPQMATFPTPTTPSPYSSPSPWLSSEAPTSATRHPTGPYPRRSTLPCRNSGPCGACPTLGTAAAALAHPRPLPPLALYTPAHFARLPPPPPPRRLWRP